MKADKKNALNTTRAKFHKSVENSPFINHFPKSDEASLYILSSTDRTCLHVGSTNNLQADVWLRKKQSTEGCVTSSFVNQLVYCETFKNIRAAMSRQAELQWASESELRELINAVNPQWKDLFRFN